MDSIVLNGRHYPQDRDQNKLKLIDWLRNLRAFTTSIENKWFSYLLGVEGGNCCKVNTVNPPRGAGVESNLPELDMLHHELV